MDNNQHAPTHADDPNDDDDAEQMLRWLEHAQLQQPPAQALVDAVGGALQRKNQLIAILAEALMESSCDCDGCVRMRAIVLQELDMRVFVVAAPVPVDPITAAKCMNTQQ
jgi:hypothetical protein